MNAARLATENMVSHHAPHFLMGQQKGIAMKTCRKCGHHLQLTEFYKHQEMADGHLNICKSCVKKRVAKHREANIDRIREYDRQRGKLAHRIELSSEIHQRYKQRHPERILATNAVNNAIRDGALTKLPCLICGNKNVEGHHPDYSRPLDVVWLCSVHHREIHLKHEETV